MSDDIQSAWPFSEKPLRRVVVKVGSNVLALAKGGLNTERITGLCNALAKMQHDGCEVILVSSGAVAAGRGILGLTKRPTEIPELQAVAAIGQGALMEEYSRQFRAHGIIVAQILLTRDDMDDRRRYLNARLALLSLLGRKVIPIINENDTVTIDELKFGDNDMLSAMVAAKMEADLLVIMSNVDGLMTGHPTHVRDAKLIPVVREITPEIEALAHGERSELGLGGMKTKLLAARHAMQFGVTCVIVNGNKEGKLERVYGGTFAGTLFLAKTARKAGSSRLHWISSRRPKGEIVVDAGAETALVKSHKSLLPVGIKAVSGDFSKGDVVRVVSEAGVALANGIVNYDSSTLARIKGKKGKELQQLLGDNMYSEVIHVNNMVVLGAG